MTKIVSRFIIEIAGKPVQNVSAALEKFKIKFEEENENFKLIEIDLNEPELNEENGLYVGFLDLECKFEDISKLLGFVADYTPTSVEIVEPDTLKFDTSEFSGILNDVSNILLKTNVKLRKYEIAANQMHKELQELKKK